MAEMHSRSDVDSAMAHPHVLATAVAFAVDTESVQVPAVPRLSVTHGDAGTAPS